MPGSMTRLARARTSDRPVWLIAPQGPGDGVLANLHVAVVGTEVSPHVTGFAHFTSLLLALLKERSGRVSQPLVEPLLGTPDLVVAVLPGPGAAAAAVRLADRHAVPLLVLMQGESAPPTQDADTTGARLAARLEATTLARATRWGVLAEAARQRLTSLGVPAARIDAMPYWVQNPTSGSSSVTDPAAARAGLGWPGGFTVVCPVGAQTGGQQTVIDAAALLEARGCEVRLVIAGRGPRLRRLSESATRLTNVSVLELADEDYLRALAAGDLLLLSELADQPDAAMAGRLASCLGSGRPLVATAAAGGHVSAELSRAEGAVVVVPPERPGQLADAIEILRGAPQARTVMAAGARHYTRVHLRPASAAAVLESIAARALNREPASWWGRK